MIIEIEITARENTFPFHPGKYVTPEGVEWLNNGFVWAAANYTTNVQTQYLIDSDFTGWPLRGTVGYFVVQPSAYGGVCPYVAVEAAGLAESGPATILTTLEAGKTLTVLRAFCKSVMYQSSRTLYRLFVELDAGDGHVFPSLVDESTYTIPTLSSYRALVINEPDVGLAGDVKIKNLYERGMNLSLTGITDWANFDNPLVLTDVCQEGDAVSCYRAIKGA